MSTNTSTVTGFRVRKRATASFLGFAIAFLVMFVAMATHELSTETYNFVLIVTFAAAVLGIFSGEPKKNA